MVGGGPGTMPLSLFFAAGLVSWTVSSLSAGGGSVLFVALLTLMLDGRAVAPVVTVASLLAAPVRMALFWRHIDWQVVRWYIPGGVCGAVVGGWLLSRLPAGWFDLAVGLFLISTGPQYRLGSRPRSFAMPLAGFVPLSFVVGLISAILGASGLIASPFYLNYGLSKEPLLATRATNSIAIQLAKIVAYAEFGAFRPDTLRQGVAAAIGAAIAIALSRPLLPYVSVDRFRRLAVLTMVAAGLYILWRRRDLLAALLGWVGAV
jgi:uncharacterized protein